MVEVDGRSSFQCEPTQFMQGDDLVPKTEGGALRVEDDGMFRPHALSHRPPRVCCCRVRARAWYSGFFIFCATAPRASSRAFVARSQSGPLKPTALMEMSPVEDTMTSILGFM